jgi:signal transduction histidine kinase
LARKGGHAVKGLPADLRTDFRELEEAFAHRSIPQPPEPVLAAARQRAAALALATRENGGALVAATFTAEMLAGLWLDAPWKPEVIDRVVDSVARVADLTPATARAAIFVRVVRSEHLYELPPKLALEAQLRMLTVFGAPTEASLWTADAAGNIACVLEIGPRPSRRAMVAARQAFTANEVATSERAQLQAVPIRRWNRAEGAIVVRAPLEHRREALGYASECGRAAGPLLELENLLERHAQRERSLVESNDRRLARLGFDLHDGPMQDIAALAQDLRLFRGQLAPFLSGVQEERILLGRLDDLDARLLSTDAELRELARSLQAPTILQAPFEELLRRDIERFQERTNVGVKLTAKGDLDVLTSSQKIALLRVVQEALNNVHEHSGADEATVRVGGGRSQLEIEVVDNGQGFSVDAALIEAAKAGRLGLVGMSERIRLLGGRLDVESRGGGPTRVKAVIPRWQPLRRPDGDGGASR